MMRGAETVPVISPKVLGVEMLLAGGEKLGWLVALKNSVRKSTYRPSGMLNFLPMPKSQLPKPGTRFVLLPAFPKLPDGGRTNAVMSSHLSRVGFGTSPLAIRLGRPPARGACRETSFAVIVIGNPERSWTTGSGRDRIVFLDVPLWSRDSSGRPRMAPWFRLLRPACHFHPAASELDSFQHLLRGPRDTSFARPHTPAPSGPFPVRHAARALKCSQFHQEVPSRPGTSRTSTRAEPAPLMISHGDPHAGPIAFTA